MASIIHHVRRHRPTIIQFSRFALVGVVNTAVSFTVYALATRPAHLDPLIGNIVAFVVAVTVSFILNRRWTFRGSSGRLHHQYLKFFLVNIVGLGLSEGIIALLHKRWGVHDIIAFMVAVIIVMFWNFGANRAWTFRSADLRSS